MQSKLVINIGSKYLSFAVFSNSINETYPILLEFIIKDIENKNNNLIGRVINREYNKLSKGYELSEVIIIPRRSTVKHQAITLEYMSDAKKMKQELMKKCTIGTSVGADYILDWSIEDDNPDEDYQKVFISGIQLEEFKFISEIMKESGIRKYKIASTSSNLGMLFPRDNKSYLLLQLGHKNSELYIIRNGIIEDIRDVSSKFSGVVISNSVSKELGITDTDLYSFKNNASFADLESANASIEILNFFKEEVSHFCESYITKTSQAIVGYTVIGGISNLDFETGVSSLDIYIPRYYPRLPVANDKQIPNAIRNYVYESVTVIQEGSECINFTAPKDKSISQYIRYVVNFFERAKVPLYIFILAILVNMGTTYVQNYFLDSKVKENQQVVSTYQGEVNSLKTTVDKLQAQYNELLDDKELAIVNYGEVLVELSKTIPQGSFIVEIRDITEQYLPKPLTNNSKNSTALLQQPSLQVATPTTDTQSNTESSLNSAEITESLNGLEFSTTDMLVALEIQGYTNQRYKAYDYALLLKQVYRDANVTNIVAEDELYKFTIHVIVNK